MPTTSQNPTEAIVLAGGMGTRLRSVVKDIPKPMAEVAGQPFLTRVLDYLAAQGIRRTVLSVGYRWEVIRDHYGTEYKGMELVYAVEDEPLGTGGAIRLASDHAQTEQILVANGDTWFGVDTEAMTHFHQQSNSLLTLALKPMRDFDRYGTVETNAQGRILAFNEKKPCAEGLINGGIYLMDRRLWEEVPLRGRFSFEKDVMESELVRLPFFGFVSEAFFIDIGIPEDYQKAQIHFAAG
jgi:D-glycero-alpha-D-manno-heptose 1-phosphate guanylyltransferase